MNTEERKHIAIAVAKMYYINGDSQEQIADATGMSRSNISRILRKCISDGIVEIVVHDTISENAQLAHKLKTHFQLKDVIIVPAAATPDRQSRVAGERVSLYLIKILDDGMTFGVARGRACYYTGRSLQNTRHIHVDTLQLQGAVSEFATMDEGSGLISLFASKLNGKGFVLNAPLMVKASLTKTDIMSSDMMRAICQKYTELGVALFEIERPTFYANQRTGVGPLSKADVLQLSEIGVTASVCGYYYNLNGRPCNAGIHDRVIAIEPNLLRKVPYSIGISTGQHALNATLSILRAKLLNVLVVDENLAQQLETRCIKNSAAEQSKNTSNDERG